MMMWPYPDDGWFPHRPQRPRSCADPDARLALAVAGVLAADDRTRRQRITVEAQNRVVLLSGEVDTRRTAAAAVALARGVAGVRDLCDGLRPQEPAGTGEDRRFDDIVAGLASAEPPRSHPVRLTGVVVARLVVAACALAVVLVGLAGWLGVLLVAVAAVMVLDLGSRRRRWARERRDPPGGAS